MNSRSAFDRGPGAGITKLQHTEGHPKTESSLGDTPTPSAM